ncbi:MAG: hypothetical protein WC596_03315 [Candidatus Shapirobacteria bacterium]
MDIPNLSVPIPAPTPVQKSSFVPVLIILFLGLSAGFWLSRLAPLGSSGSNSSNGNGKNIISADKISSAADLIVGKYYGNTSQNFKDSVFGTIKKGGINGEGTHTLLREGGVTQSAALTSSVIDLDLFNDKKVEVKGETNSTTKAGWFLDVGVIKIVE